MKTINKSITLLTSLSFILLVTVSANASSPIPNNHYALVNKVLDVELGMEYEILNDDNKIGLNISKVFSNSVGEALGLEENDVLIGIGNQPIVLNSLEKALSNFEAGEDVLLRIERNGKYQEINVKMPSLSVKSTQKAELGVQTTQVVGEDKVGAIVISVKEGSTANYLDLRKNDVILGLDNTPIINNNLNELLETYRAGDVALVRVLRENEQYNISAVLGKAEASK